MSFVIFGGGSVTEEFYLPALTRLGLAGQTTVVDPFERSLAPLRAKFPTVLAVASDHADFLATLPKDGNERIVIALPNALHVAAAELALRAGRHVLCEKPLALKAAECAHLAALAASADRRLNVAMSRRYLPSLMLARDIVASRELGAVRSVVVHDCMPFGWRPKSFAFFARETGGVLADMGVHYLDYLDTLVGPLTPVAYEDDAKGGAESSLTFHMKAGAVDVEMQLSRIHQTGEYLEIHCEHGAILIDKTNEKEVVVAPHGSIRRRVKAEQPFDDPTWPDNFHGSFCQMLSDFERGLVGGPSKLPDATDAGRAAALIEWAYAQRALTPASPPDTAPGKALVTGATGFIGGHLVERLTEQGVDVRVAARTPGTCTNVSRFPVEIAAVDLLDRQSVEAAVDGARTVYHLAYGTEGTEAGRLTIEGTKNVVEAAIKAGCDSVVVLSTMYVFGFPQGVGPVDETFPYKPYGGVYGSSKAVMERWCLERAKTSAPTRIVVLNPTCVFGPGGGAYTTMPIDMAKKGEFCWIEDGKGFCNYIYVDNLVDAVLAAAKAPLAHGERFIVNDGTVSWRTFLEPLLSRLAVPVPSYSLRELARLPRFGKPFRLRDFVGAALSTPQVREVAKRSGLVRGLFAAKERVRPSPPMGADSTSGGAADAPPRFPPVWLGPLYGPQQVRFSAAKAGAALGWTPRVSLAEAQAETLRWLVKNGRLPAQTE